MHSFLRKEFHQGNTQEENILSFWYQLCDEQGLYATLRVDVTEFFMMVHPNYTRLTKSTLARTKSDIREASDEIIKRFDFDFAVIMTHNEKLAKAIAGKELDYITTLPQGKLWAYDIERDK